jgi:hypothetical protein
MSVFDEKFNELRQTARLVIKAADTDITDDDLQTLFRDLSWNNASEEDFDVWQTCERSGIEYSFSYPNAFEIRMIPLVQVPCRLT